MNVTDLHPILRQNFTLYHLLVLSIKDTENNILSIIYTPFMLYNNSQKLFDRKFTYRTIYLFALQDSKK